jgi:hypothetical protein
MAETATSTMDELTDFIRRALAYYDRLHGVGVKDDEVEYSVIIFENGKRIRQPLLKYKQPDTVIGKPKCEN